MRSFSFPSFKDTTNRNGLNSCSRKVDNTPICVNCSGMTISEIPFRSFNPKGRLDYYLIYSASGKMHVKTENKEVDMTRGSFAIIPPNTAYLNEFDGKEESVKYMWCHFTGNYVEELLNRLGFKDLPIIKNTLFSNDISNFFNKIYDTYTKNQSFRDEELSVNLYRILLTIAKETTYINYKQNLSRSFSYIMHHYNEKIKVDDLAKMENLSSSRFNFLFKKSTGKSPVNFIIDTRINEACNLLLSTDLSIKEIGTTVGFTDNHFFSKTFKSRIKMTPKEYREKYLIT